MNTIKAQAKLPCASSSNQQDFQRVKILNGIKIAIRSPIDAQRLEEKPLPKNLRNPKETNQQMIPRILGQTFCMPILTKIVSQELAISDCGSLQEPFHNLKQSQTNSSATKISNNTQYTFENEANHTINDSIQASFSCLHNIENSSNIQELKNLEEIKRQALIEDIKSEKQVLLQQKNPQDYSQAQTLSTQNQKENRLKKERESFDFKPIAGKLKLSSQYQNIQSIKRGNKEAQRHWADLQKRKNIQQAKKLQTTNIKQSRSVQDQPLASPKLQINKQQRVIKAQPAKSGEPKAMNKIAKMTIGEKYGVTNKKMFDILQQQINHDMKEAQISRRDIPHIRELMQATQSASSEPSDGELLCFLNLRNLIREYINQQNKPNPKPQKKLIY